MKFKNTLMWRIVGVMLLLLTIIGVVNVMITTSSARKYYQETTQQLHSHVAEHMLIEVQPFINGEVNEEALGKIMHSMMAVNPNLEVYLLSPNGEILSHVVLEKEVRLGNVDLAPIEDFLTSDRSSLILGEDPRNPGEGTIFSVAEVMNGDELEGYVYMVLASEQYSSLTEALLSSYFIRNGVITFTFILLIALVIGGVLIFLLTKNLRVIIQTIRQFQEGDMHARIPVKKNDELALVGRTFNQMADTLLHNMDELKQVDALRRELIANVSHDIRSPMAVIHGYLETLHIKNDDLSAEDREKYLSIALRSSERLQKLVNDLFELSKLESNQVEMKRSAVKIDESLTSTTDEFSIIAKEKNIDLSYVLPENLPKVNADLDMIQRVIQNLLENAIKFTPESGHIDVKAASVSGGVEVTIHNTGSEIPQEDIPNLFDRYYKKDQTGTNKGAGLGLAIVKKILDVHEARIAVESDATGTSFAFTLPLAS
ncbi:sensor histidine kinase [Phaeocystidibacter luteus]|uniref:histidine kinase n=1 Tax=Phaeocystidibacter luteus TaxID=911197 RepID=A0A6N6RF88_9FLAO|nr:HAMP domain-containing sensor histidine kinase [Phaeocystidibacter luteus]KAB2805351.1 HAMP domain-containing protein [Phaeocystidibacter luteus]